MHQITLIILNLTSKILDIPLTIKLWAYSTDILVTIMKDMLLISYD